MMTRSDSFDCYKCDCCHGVKCLVMSPPVNFDTISNCSHVLNEVKIEYNCIALPFMMKVNIVLPCNLSDTMHMGAEPQNSFEGVP